jgi:hypothetical protein
MPKSTRKKLEKQRVEPEGLLREFLLDIPWTFTYHTRAFVGKPTVLAGLV